MARTPKFDYDSVDWYLEIQRLAFNGATNAEIADGLADKFKNTLCPQTFSEMINGEYKGWTKEENKRRSSKLSEVLARARRKNLFAVRNAYLTAALGGKKLKNKATTKRKLKLPDGTVTDTEDVQTTDTEVEMGPNMQALSTWLYHHDPEWRKVERKQDEDANEIPKSKEHGISIDEWIKDRIK